MALTKVTTGVLADDSIGSAQIADGAVGTSALASTIAAGIPTATVGNFTNTVVGRNGSNIMGDASDMTLDAAYLSIEFIYVDALRGWVMT